MKEGNDIIGKNGVSLRKSNHNSEKTGYRTYEVYQRERVSESTEKIKPSELISEEYRIDPYPFWKLCERTTLVIETGFQTVTG